MKVLSHRGYWKDKVEKNCEVAFKRSFDLGFGTETDIRDQNGTLVISHDMPTCNQMTLATFLQIVGNRDLPFALNIKADGLTVPLVQAMRSTGLNNWFVFDMAVPDMRAYLQAGIPVFSRMSEVELVPAWLDQVAGIWLDSFADTWYDAGLVKNLLQSGKKICVVSPELHGRNADALWTMLRPFADHSALMLCTDHPEKAQEFFGASQ